jgi:hypothetical protein
MLTWSLEVSIFYILLHAPLRQMASMGIAKSAKVC